MSRFKTAAVAPSFHNGIVFKRKGSRVRYIDPATAKVSGWMRVAPVSPFLRTVVDTYNANAEGQNVYSRMTVAELRALAGDRGIKVPSKARKADIIAMLAN
jgi:hypothetical protein